MGRKGKGIGPKAKETWEFRISKTCPHGGADKTVSAKSTIGLILRIKLTKFLFFSLIR